MIRVSKLKHIVKVNENHGYHWYKHSLSVTRGELDHMKVRHHPQRPTPSVCSARNSTVSMHCRAGLASFKGIIMLCYFMHACKLWGVESSSTNVIHRHTAGCTGDGAELQLVGLNSLCQLFICGYRNPKSLKTLVHPLIWSVVNICDVIIKLT